MEWKPTFQRQPLTNEREIELELHHMRWMDGPVVVMDGGGLHSTEGNQQGRQDLTYEMRSRDVKGRGREKELSTN